MTPEIWAGIIVVAGGIITAVVTKMLGRGSENLNIASTVWNQNNELTDDLEREREAKIKLQKQLLVLIYFIRQLLWHISRHSHLGVPEVVPPDEVKKILDAE